MLSMLSYVQSAGGGLTLSEVLSDIPHDPAAIVVYLMLAGSVLLIWRSGRTKKPGA